MTLAVQLRAAIDAQGEAQAATLRRLEPAFVIARQDVEAGPARLAEVLAEIVAVAAGLLEREFQQAAERAHRDIVQPVCEASGGRCRLRPGWEQAIEARADFYLREASERLQVALQAQLAEWGRFYREAQAFGWTPEMTVATAHADIASRGRRFGVFRSEVRRIVQETAGQGWTATWEAAWAGLEVRRDAVARTSAPAPRVPAGVA